jgi:M6 family metalloprotease-like protein
MLALGTILLSFVATALGQDFNDTQPGNDTANSTVPIRGNYTWTPTCKLPSPEDFMMDMGFDFNAGCVKGTGDLKALVIFVDFPDAKDEDPDSLKALHDKLVPPTMEWFTRASYNKLKLDVKADTSKYYRMPKAASEYDWMGRQGGNWRQDRYIQDALDAFTANGTRPPPLKVDVLYVIPTSQAANYIYRSQTYYDPISTRQGHRVAKKTITLGAADWDLIAMTMVHETGHTFCLPDYYAFNSYSSFYTGGFDVMSQTEGMAPDYFAWDKYRLGWIEDKAVDCIIEAGSTKHVLTPLAVNGGKKAVIIAGSEITALIAEVRIADGVDKDLCAPGVLLTEVNTRIAGGSGPIRVLDATPGSMGCAGNLDDLNDAVLSLTLQGSNSLAYKPVSSFDVPDWNVTVTLLSVEGSKYTIGVDRQIPVRTDSW